MKSISESHSVLIVDQQEDVEEELKGLLEHQNTLENKMSSLHKML